MQKNAKAGTPAQGSPSARACKAGSPGAREPQHTGTPACGSSEKGRVKGQKSRMAKKRILISNDDGIQARGIQALTAALAEVAEVYVCAPHRQRSAAGHGITIREGIRAEEAEVWGAKAAYAITGTPVDCVKLGLFLLRNRGIEVDMVFSGINHGSNLGTDTIYSGTVSAALEGNLKGYPAVAVSVMADEPVHFEAACGLAAFFAKEGAPRIGKETTLNINVPDLASENIRGVRLAPLGRQFYEEEYVPRKGTDGKTLYFYHGDELPPAEDEQGTDVRFGSEGYATITPIHADLTFEADRENLKKVVKLLTFFR